MTVPPWVLTRKGGEPLAAPAGWRSRWGVKCCTEKRAPGTCAGRAAGVVPRAFLPKAIATSHDGTRPAHRERVLADRVRRREGTVKQFVRLAGAPRRGRSALPRVGVDVQRTPFGRGVAELGSHPLPLQELRRPVCLVAAVLGQHQRPDV